MSDESNNSSNFWQLINKIKKNEVQDTSLNISDKEWVQYFSNLMNVSQPDIFFQEVTLAILESTLIPIV